MVGGQDKAGAKKSSPPQPQIITLKQCRFVIQNQKTGYNNYTLIIDEQRLFVIQKQKTGHSNCTPMIDEQRLCQPRITFANLFNTALTKATSAPS